MHEYIKTWFALTSDKRAVTALEYGLIAALVAGLLVTALGTYSTALNGAFTAIALKL